MRRISVLTAPLSLAGLLSISGCCGGYSVVRTTVQDGAEGSAILHYSRLGEPPNTCGSDVKLVEDLWIRLPSPEPGKTFSIGAPGVTFKFRRDKGGNPVAATAVTGRVTVIERAPDGLVVRLKVNIALPGDSVSLDDTYGFHPVASPPMVDRW